MIGVLKWLSGRFPEAVPLFLSTRTGVEFWGHNLLILSTGVYWTPTVCCQSDFHSEEENKFYEQKSERISAFRSPLSDVLPEKHIPGAVRKQTHSPGRSTAWVMSRHACLLFIRVILLSRGSQEVCHPEQHFCPLFVCWVMTLFHVLCLNGWTPLSRPSHWS